MFSDFDAPIMDVEDLATDAGCQSAMLKRRSALRTGLRCMNAELIRLFDLAKRRCGVAELTTGLASAFLPETSGAWNFLPWRIK